MTAMQLQPQRVWLLIRNDITTNVKNLAIAFGAAAGMITVLNVLTSIGYIDPDRVGVGRVFHVPMFSIFLIVGGCIASSLIFSEVHDDRRGLNYFTLPASLLEKYVARLLQTAILWPAAVIAAYSVTSLIGAGIAQLLFGESHGFYFPVFISDWDIVLSYICAHVVFVFGSIFFKKSAFIKTVFAVVVVAFSAALYVMIVGRIAFNAEFARFFPTEAEMDRLTEMLNLAIGAHEQLFRVIGDIFSYAAVPVFFLVVGFVRLRETEV
jgi:hypothetical protein